MKAVLSKTVGGPESLVIEDVPAPVPGKGQVLIEVKACGVNFPDALMLQDMYQFKPARPFAPGGEVAGFVSALGEGVSHVKPGDRVLASVGTGGMAQFCLAAGPSVMPIPDNMPFDEAAAFMMTYGTSYYALKDRADPKKGEKLLVLGAAGGVGIAAVELGKAMGLEVIAAASTQAKVDFCLTKGADKGLVYAAELDRDGQKKFADDIKAISGGGVDIVYDGVGGNYAEPAVRALNWEGRFLVIGFPAGIPKLPLNLTLLKSCDVRGVFWGAAVARDPKAHQQNVKELFELYKAGKVRPHVSNSYPLERGGEAIRELMDRKATGKVVVLI